MPLHLIPRRGARAVRAGLCGAALIFLSAGAAAACSCMRPDKGVIEQLREGAVVAVGAPQRITEAAGAERPPYRSVRYRFSVRQAIGARLPEVVIVETAPNSAMCGVDLVGGEPTMLRLLPAENGAYAINLCSQLSVEAFAEDWRALFEATAR